MSGRRALRVASSVALIGWGAALLARPDDVAAGVAGRPIPPSWLVRVLGARQLLQQLVVLAAPTPAVANAASAVDLTHAASMLAALPLAPRYRRAELASAAVAVGSAVLTRAAVPARRVG
jgi:hypothetical protein